MSIDKVKEAQFEPPDDVGVCNNEALHRSVMSQAMEFESNRANRLKLPRLVNNYKDIIRRIDCIGNKLLSVNGSLFVKSAHNVSAEHYKDFLNHQRLLVLSILKHKLMIIEHMHFFRGGLAYEAELFLTFGPRKDFASMVEEYHEFQIVSSFIKHICNILIVELRIRL